MKIAICFVKNISFYKKSLRYYAYQLMHAKMYLPFDEII